MRTPWRNPCELMKIMRKEKVDPYPEGVEISRKETARRNSPTSEAVGSHDSAPQDYDIRQSERVLEFQIRDFWTRPTDLSWHYPVLGIIRETPFKNFRWKVIREVEGQRGRNRGSQEKKNMKSRDEDWN